MSFDQTPLFQLNLFVYLGFYTSPSVCKPLLLERGFSLYCIAPRINTNLNIRTIGVNTKPPINLQVAASPDVLYIDDSKKELLIVECKISCFPVECDQANQVTTMLTFNGIDLADHFGLRDPKSWQSFLELAVSEGNGGQTYNTTQQLAQKLSSVAITPIPYGVLEISIKEDGIYLTSKFSSNGRLLFNDERVIELDEGEDPRPLYIIPLDPSINNQDDYERLMFFERIRAAIVSIIGASLDKEQFEFNQDEILYLAIPIWDRWQDRNSKLSIKRTARGYFNRVARELRKMGLNISINNNQVYCKDISREVASSIRRYLIGKAFRTGKIEITEPGQLPLSEEW